MALQPFLTNRPTVPASPGASAQPTSSGGFQRLFDENQRADSGGPAKSDSNAPKIDVIEENGRIASIVVTCRCCERIELACRY
jgi:hypothetical protein